MEKTLTLVSTGEAKKDKHHMEDSNTSEDKCKDTDIILLETIPAYDKGWDICESISMWYM